MTMRMKAAVAVRRLCNDCVTRMAGTLCDVIFDKYTRTRIASPVWEYAFFESLAQSLHSITAQGTVFSD